MSTMASIAAGRLCVVVFLLSVAPQAWPGITARTRTPIDALEAHAKQNPKDYSTWNRIADARLALAVSSGDLSHLDRAREAVGESLKAAPAESNLSGLLLRARMELALHRFSEAKESAEYLCRLNPESGDAFGLLGDALFNLGEDTATESAWTKMVERDPANILLVEPRLARLDFLAGRPAQAAARYLRILESSGNRGDDVAAWANVQLGELAFRMGDWTKAGERYDAALSVRPRYYPALEHQAELRGAEGRFDEAVALYTSLIERTRRPELMQALGDLYLFSGNRAAAAPWHGQALALYLASVEKGEPIYFHHLAIFYGESLNDPERALEWARRDLTMRKTGDARDTLAWLLYRTGAVVEARQAIVDLSIRDAGVLYHAGMIFMARGELAEGRLKLQESVALNPRYHAFHVHR